ncbi:MAG: HDOD domain-containing protein [Methylotenera sp.]
MNLIDKFFDQPQTMPMLPKVVQEVTELLNDGNVDIKTLADKINHDLVLSAKVLRLSNSAYFGCSREVSSIQEAVSLIGLAKLKTLVIACGVVSAFTEVPGLNLKRFWQHSLVTASIARQLAKDLGFDTDSAYMAGLMHTVGELPIHIVFPGAGTQIDEVCKGKNVLERSKVEHAVIGIDHCQVGEKLARHWNFPEDIARAIRYYTDPLNQNACSLAPIVYIAAHIAFDLEHGKTASEIANTLNEDIAINLGLQGREALAEKIDTYHVFVSEAKCYI